MKLGAHVSIAGGLANGPKNARALGCEVFQMFSRSPHGGSKPEITPTVIAEFKQAVADGKIVEWYIHAPYFLNLGSTNNRIFHGTISAVRDELERGSLLGAAYVMFHPGTGKEVGRKKGLEMVVGGIEQILDGYTGSTQLLIENSAGAGEILCDTFEEIGSVFKKLKGKNVGVCLDTCHAFASGYDIRTKEGIDDMIKQFDKHIGIEKLKMFHFNDSKTDFAAHRDRHEIIGQGTIGLDPFKRILNHPQLIHINGVAETPDVTNKQCDSLETLKSSRKTKK